MLDIKEDRWDIKEDRWLHSAEELALAGILRFPLPHTRSAWFLRPDEVVRVCPVTTTTSRITIFTGQEKWVDESADSVMLRLITARLSPVV